MSDTYNYEDAYNQIPAAIEAMEDALNKRVQVKEEAEQMARDVGFPKVIALAEALAATLEGNTVTAKRIMGEESDVISNGTALGFLNSSRKTLQMGGAI